MWAELATGQLTSRQIIDRSAHIVTWSHSIHRWDVTTLLVRKTGVTQWSSD
ncbi:hypothetical protein DPMN_067428 [Dreissena polymorpha]|uniref:Uncharacterized protein n=1 Tax=Dreissena polymorpha TaxID=45954 RepID=A0A9D4BTG9_DREPO|nr:hypothetical protein DPMN_067428 [Dreissena polymorpha]